MAGSEPIANVIGRLPRIGGTTLRQWKESGADIDVLMSAWSDPAITRWNPSPPDPSRDFAKRWIAGTAGQRTDSPSIDLVLVEVDAAGGGIVGELGFQIDHGRRVAELGFWVVSGQRRAGHGRTLLAYAEWLVPALEIVQAFAITDVANRAAIGLLESVIWPEVATTASAAGPERRAFMCPHPTSG